jgi:hypothetical protein
VGSNPDRSAASKGRSDRLNRDGPAQKSAFGEDETLRRGVDKSARDPERTAARPKSGTGHA